MVEDQSGTGVSISGVPNHGLVSEHGRSFLNTFPTLNPGYPCGAVHSGIWRFAASDDFIAAIRGSKSYGGRLQFRCLDPNIRPSYCDMWTWPCITLSNKCMYYITTIFAIV